MTGRQVAGLLAAMLRRELLLLRRYPADLGGQLVVVYVIFLGIFLGGRTIAPTFIEGSLEALVAGYFLWSVIVGAYSGFAEGMIAEAQWGTLEQLMMSPIGVTWIVTLYALVRIVVSVAFSTVILIAIMITTWTWIGFDLVSFVPIVAFGVLPALGIGFALGGAALVYKQVSNVFPLLQFVFAGLLVAPVSSMPALKLLPSTQGGYLLQRTVGEGQSLWTLPPAEVGILVVTGVAYLGLGVGVFYLFDRYARAKGVLAHY